jgi:adenosyl cobinamide kinase/adenosyl cobinamide phosphate guanylyltransferase
MKEKDIIEIKSDLKIIKSVLIGNGMGTGLVKKVESNTTWRYILTGGLIVVSTLIGWGIINLK